MPKHYVYRMDHDTGFAPNTSHGICTLSGCKRTTIEIWAEKASWVIGLGGDNTGKPNKVIYAMRVEENIPFSEFVKRYPEKSKYLSSKDAGLNVLMARTFYYFGDKAIDLPKSLEHIVVRNQGCKCVSDEDIENLQDYLAGRFSFGVLGRPNNFREDPGMRGRC